MCHPDSAAAARLIIDLDAIASNWAYLGARAATAQCAAVVKADAYGLGMVPVARRLHRAGCRHFFVALLEEGLQLRASIPGNSHIYVLNGLVPGSEGLCARAGLIPVLNSLEQLAAWRDEAGRQGRRLPAVLQSDTGMRRLGLAERDWQSLVKLPALTAGLDIRLVMSHLVSAELPDAPINAEQLQQFRAFRAAWPSARASLSNSSGIFLGSEFHFDLLRPGAAMYGIAPRSDFPNPLRPVVRLQARMLQCREIAEGDRVGYNHTWRAERASRIATLSVGYADGYPRTLSNRDQLSIQGHRVSLVGRVSMDTLTVDVSQVPDSLLAPGAWFDLLDPDRDINALATQAEASAYELLTRLGRRFQRTHLGQSEAAAGEGASGVVCV